MWVELEINVQLKEENPQNRIPNLFKMDEPLDRFASNFDSRTR